MAETASAVERDFVNRRLAAFLLWQGPAIVMVVVAIASIANPTRGVIWAGCLAVFGAGCVVNAFRSGRRHCYLTGPFYLFMGVAALLHGFAVVPLGSLGWLWLGVGIVAGTRLLYVPERIWGKYVGGSEPEEQGECC